MEGWQHGLLALIFMVVSLSCCIFLAVHYAVNTGDVYVTVDGVLDCVKNDSNCRYVEVFVGGQCFKIVSVVCSDGCDVTELIGKSVHCVITGDQLYHQNFILDDEVATLTLIGGN